MKCNKCGQDIPDNATFCTNCGNKIEQPQQNPNPNVQQANQVPNQNPQANQNSQANPMPNQNPQVNNGMPNQQPQFNQNPQFNQAPNRNPQFNGMPNQNVPYGIQVPQQNVKAEPSPILTWFNSAKDVFLDFFKKGYIEKPTTLLTEKNHMWLVFAVVAVVFGALKGILSTLDCHTLMLTYTVNNFVSIGAMFFAFATALFIYAKMAKNDKVTYINALNGTASAFLPVILATVANCLVTFVNSNLAYYVEISAKIMFFVLFLKLINKVVEGSKYANSFWFKSIAIICPYFVYSLVGLICFSITNSTSFLSLFDPNVIY